MPRQVELAAHPFHIARQKSRLCKECKTFLRLDLSLSQKAIGGLHRAALDQRLNARVQNRLIAQGFSQERAQQQIVSRGKPGQGHRIKDLPQHSGVKIRPKIFRDARNFARDQPIGFLHRSIQFNDINLSQFRPTRWIANHQRFFAERRKPGLRQPINC